MVSNKLLITVLTVILFSSTLGVLVMDSEGATVPDQPSHTDSLSMPSMSFTQSSSAVSMYLSEYYGDYATVIGGAYMQGNLTINDNGLPSWITYTLYSNRYDIRFTITPGSECNETFWILFSCYDMRILITFPITIIDDGGGVIPDDDQNTYILAFDTQGGSSVSPMISYTSSNLHTFDISDVRSERTGYKFLGWSTVANASTVNVVNSWTLSVSGSETSDSYTLYAVWEKSRVTIPTVWSEFAKALSNPVVLLVLVITFLAVCLFIRSRIKGMMR